MKDKWGRPALRVTYRDHDDDLAMMAYLQERALEILDAAEARKTWAPPVVPQTLGAHLLGTARMGDDPRTSVVDRFHRSHLNQPPQVALPVPAGADESNASGLLIHLRGSQGR